MLLSCALCRAKISEDMEMRVDRDVHSDSLLSLNCHEMRKSVKSLRAEDAIDVPVHFHTESNERDYTSVSLELNGDWTNIQLVISARKIAGQLAFVAWRNERKRLTLLRPGPDS